MAMASLMATPVTCEDFGETSMKVALEGLPPNSYATSFALSGGTAGTLIVAAGPKAATAVAARLLGKAPTLPLDARARGAFDEVGNIVASQFLNAVAAVLGVSCLPSVPYGHVGDGAGLLSDVVDTHHEIARQPIVSAVLRVDGGVGLRLVHAPAVGTNAELEARLRR